MTALSNTSSGWRVCCTATTATRLEGVLYTTLSNTSTLPVLSNTSMDGGCVVPPRLHFQIQVLRGGCVVPP